MKSNLQKSLPDFEDDTRIPKISFFSRWFSWLKEPPAIAPLHISKNEVSALYKYWRINIFVTIYVMYFVSYLSRKNLSAAMSPMSKSLGISNTDLGILGAVFYVTYGIGKFVNGVLADRGNIRTFLPLTITISGIASALLAACTLLIPDGPFLGMSHKSVLILSMALFWGINGWFQSAAFPLCGKALTFWFSNKERGSKWSWWSTSHEVGGSVSLVLAALCVGAFGWEGAFYIPAFVSLLVSSLALFTLRDKPRSIGLPDIEHFHAVDHKKSPQNTSHGHGCFDPHEFKPSPEDNESYYKVLKEKVLLNKDMWFLAGAFVFVYILRLGPLDWLMKYFIETNKDSMFVASMKACCVPLFGAIGTLTIPYVSDKLFDGRRAPANFFYLMLAFVSLLAFRFLPEIMSVLSFGIVSIGFNVNIIKMIIEFILLATLGISTCGPLVLIGGLCSVESASKKVAAASTGFTGSAGYVGAIFSSLGTGKIIDSYGFTAAVDFWTISALCAAVLCIPLWNKQSKL